jgi:hypothetical protein
LIIPAMLLCSAYFIFQIFHRLDKAVTSHGHDKIDGVEVFLAVKASGQIGFTAGGRMKAVTLRATKPQPMAVLFQRHIQHLYDDLVDGYLVAQHL